MKYFHIATIERKIKTGTKYVFGPYGSTQCNVQPLSIEDAQIFGVVFAKSSRGYFPFTADVEEGDRLTVNGVVYGVKGIVAHNYGGLAHKKAVLEQI